jgi:hypothetical protein|tara:strand:+ start:1275 stop:1784 length:510 start_codon:yes stop_codon:yes gene_type:complete
LNYQTHKDFLAIDFFNKIKNLILDQDFPWRKRDRMTHNANDKMYFNYCFYNYMNSQSAFYQPHIIPILKKLHAEAPIQIRANMFISALFKASHWHVDYDFKCKTAILYLNDCDGGTELKINNKIIFIKAEANKMLVFDTPISHRVITSKKEPIRYIINFNYFVKEGLEE